MAARQAEYGNKGSGEAAGDQGHAVQLISCAVCVRTRAVTRQHLQSHCNQRHAAATGCFSSSTLDSERQQCSAGNVLHRCVAAHDADTDARTAATAAVVQTRRTQWRTQRKKQKQVVATGVGEDATAAKHYVARRGIWHQCQGKKRTNAEDPVLYFLKLQLLSHRWVSRPRQPHQRNVQDDRTKSQP